MKKDIKFILQLKHYLILFCMFVTTLQAHQKYKTVKNNKCQNELCTIQY